MVAFNSNPLNTDSAETDISASSKGTEIDLTSVGAPNVPQKEGLVTITIKLPQQFPQEVKEIVSAQVAT